MKQEEGKDGMAESGTLQDVAVGKNIKETNARVGILRGGCRRRIRSSRLGGGGCGGGGGGGGGGETFWPRSGKS